MQLINCQVALGDDRRNTVPKKCIPVSEAAVLRAIHGNDSVFDIEPSSTADIESCKRRLEAEYAERGGVKFDKKGSSIKITRSGELDRLRTVYAHAKDADGNPIVSIIYPGAAARLFETVEECEFSEEHFKTIARAKAKAAPAAALEDIME